MNQPKFVKLTRLNRKQIILPVGEIIQIIEDDGDNGSFVSCRTTGETIWVRESVSELWTRLKFGELDPLEKEDDDEAGL